jgi:hypothetical protein
MSDWSDVVFCLQRMLYMCMETVMGGELFNHLSRVGGAISETRRAFLRRLRRPGVPVPAEQALHLPRPQAGGAFIFGYFWLFLVIFGYFWLFLVISVWAIGVTSCFFPITEFAHRQQRLRQSCRLRLR